MIRFLSGLFALFIVCGVIGEARAGLVGRFPGAKSLLLSANGRVAFATDTYSDRAGKTRVWDVTHGREIAALPAEAGIAVAVARDGRRVLCRRKFDEEQSSYALWWRPHGVWQAGTVVRTRGKHRLLDAQFGGGQVVLLWPDGIEQRKANGSWRQIIKWRSTSGHIEKQVKDGALSRRGTRAVLFSNDNEMGDFRAFVFDAQSGQQLKRLALAEHQADFGWNVAWKFSPDASIVGRIFAGIPDNISAPAGATNHTQLLWDARTGRKLSESSNPLLTFWPDAKPSLLNQVFDERRPRKPDEASRYRMQRLDARTQEELPFRPTRIGEGLWLNDVQFSDDGKTVVALDERGAIWEQQNR